MPFPNREHYRAHKLHDMHQLTCAVKIFVTRRIVPLMYGVVLMRPDRPDELY